MKLLAALAIALAACTDATTTNVAAQEAAATLPPPTCPGRELGLSVHDALDELLVAYCPFRPDIPNCHDYVLSVWCPTAGYCDYTLCGEELDLHAWCVTEAGLGAIPDVCFQMYSAMVGA